MEPRQNLPAVELEWQLLSDQLSLSAMGDLTNASVALATNPMGRFEVDVHSTMRRNFESGDHDNTNRRRRVPIRSKIILSTRLFQYLTLDHPSRSIEFKLQFRPPILGYLYLDIHTGSSAYSARDLACVVQNCQALRVLKMRGVKIAGDRVEFLSLARSFRQLRHICLAWTGPDLSIVTAQQHTLSAWRQIPEEGLQYVANVELHGATSFEPQQYRALVSVASMVKSLTLHGAGGQVAIRNSMLPFNVPLILNNTVIKALYLPGFWVPIGYHETLRNIMSSCANLETLMLQARSRKDAIGIAEAAAVHPALANLVLVLHRPAPIPPLHWSSVEGKMISMLKRNDKITKLSLIKRREPIQVLPGWSSLVTDGMATELKINQMGRRMPGQGTAEDWKAACLHDDPSIAYHFMRQGGLSCLSTPKPRDEPSVPLAEGISRPAQAVDNSVDSQAIVGKNSATVTSRGLKRKR